MAARGTRKYTIYEWVFLTMAEKFENQFHQFSKFGDSKSDGTTITLSQSDKWMKQAKVIDGKTITTTDTGIAFKKFKSQRLGCADYNKFIEELATTKKLNAENIKKSMMECGAPGTHSNAGPRMSSKTMNMIMRLTDPSNFTGIHKNHEPDEKFPSKVTLRARTPASGSAHSKPRSPTVASRERSPPSRSGTSTRPVSRPGVKYDENSPRNKSPTSRPTTYRRSYE